MPPDWLIRLQGAIAPSPTLMAPGTGVMLPGVPLPPQPAPTPVSPAWLQKLASGVNRVGTALSGSNQPNPYLSPQEQAAASQQQRMAMISALLRGSGPAPQGTRGPLQVFGEAISAGQGAGQGATENALKARAIEAQMMAAGERGINSRFGNPMMTQAGRAVIFDRQTGSGTYADTQTPWNGTTDPLNKVQTVTNPDGSISVVNLGSIMGGGQGTPPPQLPPQGQSPMPPSPQAQGPVARPPAIAPLVTTPEALAGAQAKAGAEATGRTEGEGLTKRQLDLPQARAALSSNQQNFDRLSRTAQRLLDNQDLWKAIGIGRGLSMIPSTAGADVKAAIKTLQSQAGFTVLQDMRNSSKSGGALGQISNFEEQLLQNYLASLGDMNQSPENFRQALSDIKDFARLSKKRFEKAFADTYPGLDVRSGQEQKQQDLPNTNGRGWILHEDAQGNKAYVSPDGKQYEEVAQ